MKYLLIAHEILKLIFFGLLKMSFIRTPIDALKRFFFILVATPTVVWAGIRFDNTLVIDQTESVKVLFILLASLAGGVSSSFVKTSFDESVNHPVVFKILVGVFIGAFAPLAIQEIFGFGFFSILFLSFFLASLGAPIMAFYLMWISNAETQEEIKESIKRKVREKLNISEDSK